MYTSVTLLALSGWFASASVKEKPAWLTEYTAARNVAQLMKKPLAVVVGSGQEGWDKLSQEGKLAQDVNRLLAGNYVCVYLDTAEAAKQRLAVSFELGAGPGVVISDRTGGWQAFHHQGGLSNDALAGYLRRFAEQDHVVQHTETYPAARVSYYPSSAAAPASNGYQPAGYAPANFSRSISTSRGGC